MVPRQGILAVLAMGLLSFACARTPFMAPVDATPDACQACLVSVRLLEDFLCDPAATDFLVDFVDKQICPKMGDTAQCHNLAEGLLPTIVQWFRASATPASLCSSAGVCGARVAQVPSLNKPALRVHDGVECAMCKLVVGRVKAAINDSQTLDKIKEVALQVCSGLPGELATSCSDFVNSYEPMIAELVESMDPDTVCALAGVCLEGLVAHPPPPLPAQLLRLVAQSPVLRQPPPPPMSLAMAQLGMPSPFFPPPHPEGGFMGGLLGGLMHGLGMGGGSGPHGGVDGQEEPRGGVMPMGGPMGGPMGPMNDACVYCKMAVLEAHSLVSNPSVQSEVVNYTLAICDNFPSFAEPCKTYVTVYAPLVFTLLEQYLVPDTLCAQTGMCPPTPADAAEATSDGFQGAAMVALMPAHTHTHGEHEHEHGPHGPLGWLLRGLRCVARHLGLLPPPPPGLGAGEGEGAGVAPWELRRAEPEPEAAPRVEPPK